MGGLRTLILAGAGFGLAAGADVASASTGLHGYWVVEGERAIVEIAPCGAELCGDIVWFRTEEQGVNPPGARDARNADEQMRDRPICGLRILWGLTAAGRPDVYKRGRIYDPEIGETYRANVSLDEAALKLRGYLGTPAIGRTETWSRPQAAFDRCGELPAKSSDLERSSR